jgi:hypothetical protein
MEVGRIARQVAECNPQGKMRHGRLVITWKDGIRDSMQRRNLKDEKCFDQELWRKKLCLCIEEICVFTEKFLYIYIYIYIYIILDLVPTKPQ